MKRVNIIITILTFVIISSLNSYSLSAAIDLKPDNAGSEMIDYTYTCSDSSISALFDGSFISSFKFGASVSVEITFSNDVNIWYMPTPSKPGHAVLNILRFNGSSFVETGLSLGSDYSSDSHVWYKGVTLEAGTYHFYVYANRHDSEWYFEAASGSIEPVEPVEPVPEEPNFEFTDIASSLETLANNQILILNAIDSQTEILESQNEAFNKLLNPIISILSYIQSLAYIFVLLCIFIFVLYIFYCCLIKFY